MSPSTYRATDFLRAGEAAGVEVVIGTPVPQALAGAAPAHNLTISFQDPGAAARQAVAFAASRPLHAVLGVDDDGVVPAAAIAAALGLRHNTVAAAAATRDKAEMRRRLRAAQVPAPAWIECLGPDDSRQAQKLLRPPWVVKPTTLSASRGVIRADTPEALDRGVKRAFQILARASRAWTPGTGGVLVEEYIPGAEVALEGLLTGGELQTLALFDKPDPLEGPYFPETIYVTPSRQPARVQDAVARCAADAARALGLQEGPVHAELRLNSSGVWVVEVAARTIGGLCSRALRFGTGMSLEELMLRHACGLPVAGPRREASAAGVYMLPVPEHGVLEGVDGADTARQVPGIEEITITVAPGQEVEPLPAGDRYLGFLFARGARPGDVEAALRRAHQLLRPRIRPLSP